jgi:hypothetical protein
MLKYYLRTRRYAVIQARIRARIGKIPGDKEWRNLAVNLDLQSLLDAMNHRGLGFWITDLTASADPERIERLIFRRLRLLISEIGDLLPQDWSGVSKWLSAAPDIFWVDSITRGASPALFIDIDSPLNELIRLPVDQRHDSIMNSNLAQFVIEGQRSEQVWLDLLPSVLPKLNFPEQKVFRKLNGIFRDYLFEKNELVAGWQSLNPGGALMGLPVTTSQTHAAVKQQLHTLLAGDPFHAGTIVIYGLLEFLNMVKTRELLLSRVYGWSLQSPIGSSL